MQARCNVVALCSWWMLTRLHCAKLQAAAGAPAKESDSSERVLEKLPRCVRPLRPSIPPSLPPACSFAPFPSPLAPHLISFYVTRACCPLSHLLAVFISLTDASLHRRLHPSRSISSLSRARARISSSPLCALLPLSPSADHHRHERRRFNLESTAKLLREQNMVTGKVEKEEGEGEAVEG